MYITMYLLSLVLHRVADKRLAKEPDCSIRFDCNHRCVVRVDENSDLTLAKSIAVQASITVELFDLVSSGTITLSWKMLYGHQTLVYTHTHTHHTTPHRQHIHVVSEDY